MSVTTSENQTNALVLNRANPNQISDVLAKVKLGRMLSPIKITLAGITASATVDLTSFLKGVATLTINSGLADLATGEALPAIQLVKTLRCSTSGTANSVGTYGISDAGGTAVSPTASSVMGIALLSDDGTTLTFPTTITGLVLEYIPLSATDLTDEFSPLPVR